MKTIKVSEETHEKLVELKPYPSVSFDDLLREMAGQYDQAEERVWYD